MYREKLFCARVQASTVVNHFNHLVIFGLFQTKEKKKRNAKSNNINSNNNNSNNRNTIKGEKKKGGKKNYKISDRNL